MIPSVYSKNQTHPSTRSLPSNATTLNFDDGSIYIGEVKNGKPHGQGEITLKVGNTYIGGFQNGKLHGQVTRSHKNVGQFNSVWNNGHLTDVSLDTDLAKWCLTVFQKGIPSVGLESSYDLGHFIMRVFLPYSKVTNTAFSNVIAVYKMAFDNTRAIGKIDLNDFKLPTSTTHLILSRNNHVTVCTLVDAGDKYQAIISNKGLESRNFPNSLGLCHPFTAGSIQIHKLKNFLLNLSILIDLPQTSDFHYGDLGHFIARLKAFGFEHNPTSPLNQRTASAQNKNSCWLNSYQQAIKLHLILEYGDQSIGDVLGEEATTAQIDSIITDPAELRYAIKYLQKHGLIPKKTDAHSNDAYTQEIAAKLRAIPAHDFLYKFVYGSTRLIRNAAQSYLDRHPQDAAGPNEGPPIPAATSISAPDSPSPSESCGCWWWLFNRSPNETNKIVPMVTRYTV